MAWPRGRWRLLRRIERVSDLGFDLRREGFEIFQRRTDPPDRFQLLTVHYTIIRISVYLSRPEGLKGYLHLLRDIRVLMSTQSKKPLALHDFDAWILETLQQRVQLALGPRT